MTKNKRKKIWIKFQENIGCILMHVHLIQGYDWYCEYPLTIFYRLKK